MTTRRTRVSVPYPSDVSVPIYVSSSFTFDDVLRIGAPTIAGGLAFGLPGAIAGGVTGGVASKLPVHGATLDRHIWNWVRNQTRFGVDASQTGTALKQDVLRADEGPYIGVVRVSPVALRNRSQAEQQAVQRTVHDLFNELDPGFGINLYSMQHRTDASRFATDQETVTVTDHFVITRDSDRDVVDDRCDTIVQELSGGFLDASRVSGTDLREFADRYAVGEVSTQRRRFQAPCGGDMRWFRGLYVTDYPTELDIGWLADCLNVDGQGLVDVVQTVEPGGSDALDRVERMIDRAHLGLAVVSRPGDKDGLESARKDARDMLGMDDSVVRYAAHVLVSHRKRSVVDATFDRVKRVLRRYRIGFREPWLQMREIAAVRSLFIDAESNAGVLMPAGSAAAGLSFASGSLVEDGGVLVGSDRNAGTPVILNRFQWDAGHVAVMGKIGSGKSFWTKLHVLRMADWVDDLKMFFVDPKQEYRSIASQADCPVRHVTVEDRTADNEDRLIDAARQAYKEGCEFDGKTIVVMDEAWRLLRSERGRDVVGELIREGRDQNIAATLVTQNASDFTRSQEGRDILKNIDCYVFLRHQDVASAVQDFFNLSDEERVQLRQLRTGRDAAFSEAVIRGPVNTTVRVRALDEEHEVITNA